MGTQLNIASETSLYHISVMIDSFEYVYSHETHRSVYKIQTRGLAAVDKYGRKVRPNSTDARVKRRPQKTTPIRRIAVRHAIVSRQSCVQIRTPPETPRIITELAY